MREQTQTTALEVNLSEIAPFIDACFQEGCTITLTVTGNSMRPFLRHNRDRVVLAKTDGILKKGDVPLYIRKTGQYVLHRVSDVKGGLYTMTGDAQTTPERGVKPEQIIAVSVAFLRGGKQIDCHSRGYRLYVWLWGKARRARPFLLRIYNLFHKIYRGETQI